MAVNNQKKSTANTNNKKIKKNSSPSNKLNEQQKLNEQHNTDVQQLDKNIAGNNNQTPVAIVTSDNQNNLSDNNQNVADDNVQENKTNKIQKAGATKKKQDNKNKKKIDNEIINDENMLEDNKKRYFKLEYNNEVKGRISGKKPKQAANKGLTAIIKSIKGEETENREFIFSIRECTRGSKQKTYSYSGTRYKLLQPVKVSVRKDNVTKEIEYKYSNKIKKLILNKNKKQKNISATC